jgi:hypothetical protein
MSDVWLITACVIIGIKAIVLLVWFCYRCNYQNALRRRQHQEQIHLQRQGQVIINRAIMAQPEPPPSYEAPSGMVIKIKYVKQD